ncbi:MAG: AtpZ/AtpI family protein [Patescibacteria group bacterium]
MASDLKQLHKSCEHKELKDLLGKALRLEKRYTRPNPLNLVRMIRDGHCWCLDDGSQMIGIIFIVLLPFWIAMLQNTRNWWFVLGIFLFMALFLISVGRNRRSCSHKTEKEKRLAFVREHPLQAAMEEEMVDLRGRLCLRTNCLIGRLGNVYIEHLDGRAQPAQTGYRMNASNQASAELTNEISSVACALQEKGNALLAKYTETVEQMDLLLAAREQGQAWVLVDLSRRSPHLLADRVRDFLADITSAEQAANRLPEETREKYLSRMHALLTGLNEKWSDVRPRVSSDVVQEALKEEVRQPAELTAPAVTAADALSAERFGEDLRASLALNNRLAKEEGKR